MESPQPLLESEKKNRTPLIITVVTILLCCCCLVIAIAGYYGYNTLRISESETIPFEDATPEVTEPSTDNDYDLETPVVDAGVGEAPTGGLGNDILRNDTWTYVAFAAMGQGCDEPVGADTVIDVLQEPANGVWVEKWIVACASGDAYPYEIEFVLDDTGTTFNIKSLP